MIYRDWLQKRLGRQRAFFASSSPGDMLFYRNVFPFFEVFWEERLLARPLEELFCQREIENINRAYIRVIEDNLDTLLYCDDDTLPAPEVCFGIGSIVAAMGGGYARFTGGTSWCAPSVGRMEDIEKLRFDPDNVWVRFCIAVYQNLLDLFDGQFLALPYVYRSPLDGANGLRGDEIFVDMYEQPELVKALADWCAGWNLAMEAHIAAVITGPKVGRGVWGIALPERGVFVNGDPVGLVNSGFVEEFDRPYTEKFFTATGGGFLHHHAIGFRHTGRVAGYKGLYMQNVLTDPNQPVPAERMLANPDEAEMVVQASLKAPVHINGDFSPYIDRLLDIARRGRFVLRYEGPPELMPALLEKVNAVRN